MVDDVIAAMILGRQKSNTIRDHLRGKAALGNVHVADNVAWHIKNGRLDASSVKNILSPDDYNLVETLTQAGDVKKGFR